MIAEGIQALAKIGEHAGNATNKFVVVELPDHKYVTVEGIGVNVSDPIQKQGSRNIELDGVIEFGKLLTDFKTRHNANPTIWYDKNGVATFIHDQIDSLLLESATLTFGKTPQHEALLKPQAANHRAFLRQLRTIWWDCFEDNSARHNLVEKLKKLDFTNSTKSDVAVGRASYGTAAAVTASGADIEGEISLQVRFFTDPSLDQRYQVTCLLDIDLEKQTFAIIPLGDALELAIQSNMEKVRDILEASSFPVFHGRPNVG